MLIKDAEGGEFASQADYISLGPSKDEHASFRSTYSTRPPPNRLHESRREPEDRPKSKHILPGCAPWLLIKTRLKRRFVHNPDTRESYWNFPAHVAKAVVQFDIEEARRKGRQPREERLKGAKSAAADEDNESNMIDQQHGDPGSDSVAAQAGDRAMNGASDDEEYDEVIEEYEEDEDEQLNDDDHKGDQKRPRLDENSAPTDQQTIEFGEDDMAWQLAQMEDEYDDDAYDNPDAYGSEEGGLEAQARMSDQELASNFAGLMEEYNVSPYSTWEKVIEDVNVVSDGRYTLFSSMKDRREAFAAWSMERIKKLKETRANETKRNPKAAYLAFLHKHATPKLFWPEFRRKYRNEGEMKDFKMSDKDREKLYREHISRTTKMKESDLRRDLEALLLRIPVSETWHSRILLSGSLPDALTTDIRYISLKPSLREPVIQEVVSRLPPPNNA